MVTDVGLDVGENSPFAGEILGSRTLEYEPVVGTVSVYAHSGVRAVAYHSDILWTLQVHVVAWSEVFAVGI